MKQEKTLSPFSSRTPPLLCSRVVVCVLGPPNTRTQDTKETDSFEETIIIIVMIATKATTPLTTPLTTTFSSGTSSSKRTQSGARQHPTKGECENVFIIATCNCNTEYAKAAVCPKTTLKTIPMKMMMPIKERKEHQRDDERRAHLRRSRRSTLCVVFVSIVLSLQRRCRRSNSRKTG